MNAVASNQSSALIEISNPSVKQMKYIGIQFSPDLHGRSIHDPWFIERDNARVNRDAATRTEVSLVESDIMGGTTIRRLIGHRNFTASVQRFVIQRPTKSFLNSNGLVKRRRACRLPIDVNRCFILAASAKTVGQT